MARAFLFILISAVAMAGCSSFGPVDPPEAVLPEITQEGLGTMGCTVNGEVVVARKTHPLEEIPPIYASINDLNKVLISLEDRVAERYFSINFNTSSIDSDSTFPQTYYVWREPTLVLEPRLTFLQDEIEARQFAQSVDSCWIEFTRFEPYSGGILSGTFSFDLLTQEGDTLTVREGRFDVQLIGL